MKVSIFPFLLLFCFGNSDDSIPCRFSDGSFGKCVDIRTCKSLYGLYRQGTIRVKDLPICDPVKRLVCCPRISTKKCKEYGVTIGTKCRDVPHSLIVEQGVARPLEFPHQALLGYQINDEVKWICSGSLISPDFVLTAAHCISSIEYGAVKFVKLAVLDRSYDGINTEVFTVKQTFKHSKDRLFSLHNDIALLKLQGSVKIDGHIWPICLPARPYYDAKAIVTGFRDTGTGNLSQKLMKVIVDKFDHQTCIDQFAEKYNESTMLCYGHHTERKDTCIDDAGGPLQVSNDEQVNCTYTQIVIVSYEPRFCGGIRVPSSYVNVYKYLDWIEGIVWKHEA